MTCNIIAIRPQPGLDRTISAGEKLGLDVAGFSLFEIEHLDWQAPDPNQFEGLIAGSANVFRSHEGQLRALSGLPVHAVGEYTAGAAEEAGFKVSNIGSGGLQALLDGFDNRSANLLRLAGEEHVSLMPPHDCRVTTVITYRVKPVEFPLELRNLLARPAVVLLHSAAAATHFASECERWQIDRSQIVLAALGPRIVENVGEGWSRVECAGKPQENALLALAKNLCETI